MSYYISPRFLNKLAVHITKNYLDLPQVKVPLILGVHGRKGEGKTFQCELVFERMGVEVVYISGGELESPDAGDPARLVRMRYREAAELVRVRGRMAVLMINDLDAGAGRFDRMTQYTVNTQLVNNTLMNIADNPTNVQLPGSYDEKPLPRIPIIATGNDFATLYAPLIRDGRMQKFYWEPSRADRLGIVGGMYADDGLSETDVEALVSRFEGQAVDFFGAVRSQIYDQQITRFIEDVGIENVAAQVVNALKVPSFSKPNFQLEPLIAVGESLVAEQERVRTMSLVNEYNQALTPNGGTRLPRSSSLLTLPSPNGLSPYVKDKAANGSQNSTSSLWKRAKAARLGRADSQLAINKDSNSRSSSFEPQLSQPADQQADSRNNPNAMQQLRNIIAMGHRVGIEYVDQRRFRVNSWQIYTTLDSSNESEAMHSLNACLAEFADHYIRLIGIDPYSKQRMTETIIHRP
ncbi:MAG: ribulose bisphosphate carboxylase small subunit [Cyanobacteria bacterium P01_C01_bin.69]